MSIANTTENTAQLELGGQQLTVSPGTTAVNQFGGADKVKMHAVSDGLDREFTDEAAVAGTVIR